jgi:hypothetical protein
MVSTLQSAQPVRLKMPEPEKQRIRDIHEI